MPDPSLSNIARSLARIATVLEKIERKMQTNISDQIRMGFTVEDDYCEEPHDHHPEES